MLFFYNLRYSMIKDNDINFNEFPKPDYESWKKAAEAALKGVPIEKKLITRLYEDIDLQPIYNPENFAEIENLFHIPPGSFPYIRGTANASSQSQADILQKIQADSPDQLNQRIKSALKNGQNAIYLHPGLFHSRSGLPIAIGNINDLERSLDGINPEEYPLHINAGTASEAVMHSISTWIRGKNYNIQKVHGSVQYDPISLSLNQYGMNYSLGYLIQAQRRIFGFCETNLPELYSIGIDSTIIHNGGGNICQELAYSLAVSVYYIKFLLESGNSISQISRKIILKFAIGSNFFSEIAKLRAAKLLWSILLKSFDAVDNDINIKIITETSGMNKSRLDPNTNMLRATIETFAAVLAGADGICTSPYDHISGTSSALADRLARNTQLVINHESHTLDTIDPAGGSWFIESLTNSLAEKAWDMFREIEHYGGIIKYINDGMLQRDIADVCEKRISNLVTRKELLIGTNVYPNIIEKVDFTGLDDSINNDEGVQEFPTPDLGSNVLVGSDDESVSQFISEAVKNNDSFKFIQQSIYLRKGDENPLPVMEFRAAEAFERLRYNADNYLRSNGKLPSVYLANFGKLSDYNARNDFAQDYFRVGGFEIIDSPGYPDFSVEYLADAVRDFLRTDAPVIAICSSDIFYPEFVPQFARLIKKAKPLVKIYLAGYPKDLIDEFRSAGIDGFVHVKSNIIEILSELQSELGMSL